MHIDWWTLALQAVNVLILIWILARFFYRPIVDIIERRRAAAAKALTDASAMRSAADAERAGIQATRAGFTAERDALLSDASKQIETERATMLREASERIETLRLERDAALASDRSAMERAVAKQASALAVQIAQKLLERLPAEAALAIFLNALSKQIKALPPKERELLAASAQAGILSVTTPSALNGTEEEQCQKAIKIALGLEGKIAFRVDTRLIAGVELSGGALVLKNNWQNDLAQILQHLQGDDGQR
ncbi:MAG TPA: hypothetical protein VN154_10630 [Rhizomicrobium sp.]|nr:hypothetical protein [Rhizomicrobium sp.]